MIRFGFFKVDSILNYVFLFFSFFFFYFFSSRFLKEEMSNRLCISVSIDGSAERRAFPAKLSRCFVQISPHGHSTPDLAPVTRESIPKLAAAHLNFPSWFTQLSFYESAKSHNHVWSSLTPRLVAEEGFGSAERFAEWSSMGLLRCRHSIASYG